MWDFPAIRHKLPIRNTTNTNERWVLGRQKAYLCFYWGVLPAIKTTQVGKRQVRAMPQDQSSSLVSSNSDAPYENCPYSSLTWGPPSPPVVPNPSLPTASL